MKKRPAISPIDASPPPLPEVGPALLRRINEQRILQAVQAQGPMSRAALVRRTGISPPTVSKLVRSLMRGFLLEEGDAPQAIPGRPACVLRLASKGARVLGAVIDTRECSIVASGLDGRIDNGRILRFPTPGTYDQLIHALSDHARRLMPRGAKAPTLALGVSVPGLIDRKRQQVLLSANIHMLDQRFPANDLQRQLKIPTVLLHETDALCLGERANGQARGMDDFVLVDATSGLGAAVMSNGRIVAGHRGMAGEVGHITVEAQGRRCGCGNIGCLETVASDAALAALVSEKIGHTLDITQVIQRIREGKLNAREEIDRTIEYLAIGVAAVINIFNPGAVLVQSRMFQIREGMFDLLLDRVRRRALSPALADCTILRASGDKLSAAIAGTIHHLTSVSDPRI